MNDAALFRLLRCFAGLVCAAAALGCEGPAPLCRFGGEYRLFQSASLLIHALRPVELAAGALALFSDPSGVYAQPLARDGAPRSAAQRLFPPCTGGLDAEGGPDSVRLACLRRAPAAGQDSEGGKVALYELDLQLVPVLRAEFGQAGRLSQGIALGRAADGAPAVLWHDAALSGGRVWYFEPARMAAPEQLSLDGWEASAPSLAAARGRLYAGWAETRYAGDAAQSRIRIRDVRAHTPPKPTLWSRDPAPSPRLSAVAGALVLAFRDRRESLRKTGLYLARLDAEGQVQGRIIRAGRADGDASLVLETCLGGVLSATPRSFAGDYFVALLHADAQLRRLSAEQQFYQDSREFDRVGIQCNGARALLLIAERGRLFRGNAALRSTTFRCGSARN